MPQQIDVTFLIVSFIGVMATIISFFSVRMIKQVDASQKELWIKMDNTRERLSSLEGEHRAFTTQGVHQ